VVPGSLGWASSVVTRDVHPHRRVQGRNRSVSCASLSAKYRPRVGLGGGRRGFTTQQVSFSTKPGRSDDSARLRTRSTRDEFTSGTLTANSTRKSRVPIVRRGVG